MAAALARGPQWILSFLTSTRPLRRPGSLLPRRGVVTTSPLCQLVCFSASILHFPIFVATTRFVDWLRIASDVCTHQRPARTYVCYDDGGLWQILTDRSDRGSNRGSWMLHCSQIWRYSGVAIVRWDFRSFRDRVLYFFTYRWIIYEVILQKIIQKI